MAGMLAVGAGVALAATQPRLGTAGNYAVIGASAITSTGPTVINGNLAISPGGPSSVTGFLPGVVTGEMDMANADALLAQSDLVTAYNDAAAETTTVNLTGTDLGGLTLTPGTYTFDSSAQLTGTLTLDGEGSSNAMFVFQIGSTLTTASASSVQLINGAGGCAVFWQVGSSATLGTTTDFQGSILAMTSITMTTGATIGVGGIGSGGRALARSGAVTLDTNVIIPPPSSCLFAPVPTPIPTAAPTAVPTALPAASPSATAAPTRSSAAGALTPPPGRGNGTTASTQRAPVPSPGTPTATSIPGLPNTAIGEQTIAHVKVITSMVLAVVVLLAGAISLLRRRHA